MKLRSIFFCFLVVLFSVPTFAQLDLKEKAQLMGIQVDERQGAKAEVRNTDVSFIFSGKPTQYFHIFRDSILELQFYDAVVGDEQLQSIEQAPFIAGGSITTERLNVNKDIEGLSPLFKDVVRVQLPIEKGMYMDFTVTDDYNVITLKTIWSRTVKVGGSITQTKTKTRAIVIGGVVLLTGGAISYILFGDGNGGTPPEDNWTVTEPTLPNL